MVQIFVRCKKQSDRKPHGAMVRNQCLNDKDIGKVDPYKGYIIFLGIALAKPVTTRNYSGDINRGIGSHLNGRKVPGSHTSDV